MASWTRQLYRCDPAVLNMHRCRGVPGCWQAGLGSHLKTQPPSPSNSRHHCPWGVPSWHISQLSALCSMLGQLGVAHGAQASCQPSPVWGKVRALPTGPGGLGVTPPARQRLLPRLLSLGACRPGCCTDTLQEAIPADSARSLCGLREYRVGRGLSSSGLLSWPGVGPGVERRHPECPSLQRPGWQFVTIGAEGSCVRVWCPTLPSPNHPGREGGFPFSPLCSTLGGSL